MPKDYYDILGVTRKKERGERIDGGVIAEDEIIRDHEFNDASIDRVSINAKARWDFARRIPTHDHLTIAIVKHRCASFVSERRRSGSHARRRVERIVPSIKVGTRANKQHLFGMCNRAGAREGYEGEVRREEGAAHRVQFEVPEESTL